MGAKKKPAKRRATTTTKDIDALAHPENEKPDFYTSGRRKRWSVSDVMTAVILAEDEDQALARLAAMHPSKSVLRAASTRFKESESYAGLIGLLERHAESAGIRLTRSLDGAGGKKCPRAGESRVYSVQSSRRGPKLYVTLPVNSLPDVAPGAHVVAQFSEAAITITPGA